MPHFEPSTGLESFCTLDRYIQQHIKAATGNPSPEVLVLQSTVDRLREARNQAVRDRHTLHGQYNELVRTHNDNVARMRTLDTIVANAKKEFENNLQTIVELRAGYKVEQDRAGEARKKSERDAVELARVTAELHDIKTVTNHPGILFTKLQAERDAKEESIKKLEKRVAKAEEAAVVERNLRYLAETTAAQKARELEASQPTIGRLSTRVSELEKECAEQKTLKYDLAVARSDLKNANTEVNRLREAQSGIMARSDDMRTKNDGLTERVAELEAEALLPMPSTLLVHPGATANTTSVDQSTPLVDLPLQITLLKCALEQTRVDLKQAQADNVQLKSQITDLGTGAARSKVGLAVCRTQLKDSKDEQVLTEKELEESKTRNERFIDQIGDLKEMISKYEAQIELPLPSQTATPTVNHQHSVVVCDLQLEIATYKSELEKVRAELKQSLSDLEEARFPWYGMVLEQKEGQEGEEKKEAVDIVKAKIHALETTITTLQSTNGALQLQLDDIAAKAELKRLKDLAIKNARETTKLQILHSGGAGVIDVTTPTPTANPESSVVHDDMMEVEVEVEVEGECDCGREEVIKEMASRSEVVFEQTLILLENVRNAAQSKVEDSPLKDRAQSVRNVEVLTRYMEKVEGLVEHAREGVANRLG
jgi:chromosome segregation ATPase